MTASIMSDGIRRSSQPEAGLLPSYVAILWCPEHQTGVVATQVAARLQQAGRGLAEACRSVGAVVMATSGPRAPRILRAQDDDLILIGRAFERSTLGEGTAESLPAQALTRLSLIDLPAKIWGGYIAVGRDRSMATVTVLRDPSGALGAYVAQAGPLLIISDAMPRWLREAAGIVASVEPDALLLTLANPLRLTHGLALAGIETLPAGCARTWDGKLLQPSKVVWPTAGRVAAQGPVDLQFARGRLRAAVVASCCALAASRGPIILELSGGLDSTIVLGALASAPERLDLTCVNFAATHSGGDERAHARAAAEHWGVRLVEIEADAREFRYEDILQQEQPVEPVIFGLDPLLERASIGVADVFDAGAILTGQGGDSVFYNRPTPWSAVDRMRDLGWRGCDWASAVETALRAGCSVWYVYAMMFADRFKERREPEAQLPGAHLAKGHRAQEKDFHPWLTLLPGLPPGRRDQLRAIANCQHFNGPTWRASRVPLLHPLLSQPVVEACFSIPTYQLASGTLNRKLAREAFADWLPAGILARHGKGDASTYYRRAVAENASFLRDYLGNGTLVAHGYLNGDALVAALDPDSLLWSDDARLIATYAAFEAWARYWGLG